MGLLAGLAGIVALFAGNKSKQKVKEIKEDIKTSEKKVEKLKEETEATKQTQQNFKKTLIDMVKKKELYEAKDVESAEADQFVRDFLKKRKTQEMGRPKG